MIDKTKGYKRKPLDRMVSYQSEMNLTAVELSRKLGYSDGAVAGWMGEGAVHEVVDNLIAAWQEADRAHRAATASGTLYVLLVPNDKDAGFRSMCAMGGLDFKKVL